MARRGWTRSIIAAVLASAGSAAAQLGLGYGLGILVWAPNDANAAGTRGAWWAALAWTTWVAATSVVVGAVVGDRYGGRSGSGLFVRVGRRVVMALAATIGGLVTVPLVAIPARGAQIVDNYAPEILAGVFAATGVVLGLVVALLALVARAIAANVFLSAIWLWALATVVVVDGLTSGRGIEYAQLGVWKFTEGGPSWRSIYIPGALLMLGAALLIGGLAGERMGRVEKQNETAIDFFARKPAKNAHFRASRFWRFFLRDCTQHVARARSRHTDHRDAGASRARRQRDDCRVWRVGFHVKSLARELGLVGRPHRRGSA